MQSRVRISRDAVLASSVARTLLAASALAVPLVTTSTYHVYLGTGTGRGPLVLATLLPLLLFTALHWRKLLSALTTTPELTILTCLVPASALWSIHAPTTIERSVPFLVTTLSAFAIGAVFRPRAMIAFYAFGMGFAMLVSMLAVFAIPESQGIGKWETAWNGVYNHKNALGMATVIAILVASATVVLHRGGVRLGAYLVIAVSVLLLIGSQSLTSQIITLLVLTAVIAGAVFPRVTLSWAIAVSFVFVSLVLLGVVVLASGLADPLIDLLGRKPTLSGRLPLWGILAPWVGQEPFLGYGYEAFWRSEASHVIAMDRNPKLFFSPHYSHNGVLEMLLAVGWAGFGLLVFGLVRAFAALFWQIAARRDRTEYMCLFTILIGLTSLNFTESFLIAPTSAGWMIMISTIVSSRLTFRRLRNDPRKRHQSISFVRGNAQLVTG